MYIPFDLYLEVFSYMKKKLKNVYMFIFLLIKNIASSRLKDVVAVW